MEPEEERRLTYPSHDLSMTVCPTIEVSEELLDEIDGHVREDETREEFIEELVHHYEAEGATTWEGFGGPP